MHPNAFRLAAALLVAGAAPAAAHDRYSPVSDPVTAKECGACHMAFQPQMLPGRSWTALMGGLDRHFGEDASLDDATRDHITAYLTDHAADAGWWSGKFMRGVDDSRTPLRITDTPYWIREHMEEVPARAWTDPRVGSKANCLACHPRANRGDYDDD